MNVDLSEAQTILGSFCEIPQKAIQYELYEMVKDYKARIASKFKSIRKDSIDRIQGNEFYISNKLDGEHCELYFENNQACLLRPRGYAYTGLKLLDDAIKILSEAGVKRAMFPGELYVKKPDGVRTRVFDVISITKSPKSQADLDLLHFAPFDIIFLDEEVHVNFADVRKRIMELFTGTPLEPPAWEVSNNHADIHRCYEEWVNQQGSEGLMIRTDLTFRYKLKASHTVDAVIIGYTAANEMVTSVLTGLVLEDGNIQVLGSVEKGFSDVQRMDLLQKLKPAGCKSDYMEVSRFHTPFHMVRPKIIMEFSCNDMVAETSNGRPIKKATLRLKDDVWRLVRSSPFVSMKHSVFIRFRDDKQVNAVDLRATQITDYIFIDVSETPAQEITFPDVEVLVRDVYFKKVKEKLSIRKILVWKTNKDVIDSNYSAYVLNYTDYSAGRKDPLKQDVRISDSRHQILQLAQQFKEKNIKKGWELYKPEE